MTHRNHLEAEVMEALWAQGEGSVREVLERLDHDFAYTTVMTVLDRLHAKGRVLREKIDGAWRYRAALSRGESIGQAMASMLCQVKGDPRPALLAFLDHTEDVSPETFDRLDALIRARRRGEA